jgi:UDP-glucose 4-epimerase
MTARYLVTGGAGFIGSHLVEALLRRGDAVYVLDNFATGKRENLAALPGGEGLQPIEGSVADPAAVARAADGVRGIFHLAALPSVSRSVEAPLDSHENNVTGTVVVLDHARRHGIKVVYAGSSSAYGNNDAPSKREDLRESPLSPYAAAKLGGELYCRSFAQVYGLATVVTRFFNVFGPRQTPDSPYSGVVAAFCLALLRGRSPRIDGDGLQSRDFTYVDDVVRGVCAAMDRDVAPGSVINLACGASHTIRELLDVLCAHARTNVEPAFAPPRAGDVRHSKADIRLARELLDFSPRVSFAEGLRRTFDWYRSIYA